MGLGELRRALRVIPVCLWLSTLTACASSESPGVREVVVGSWTLHANGEERSVVLPVDLNRALSRDARSYTIEADVEIPAPLRGRELVLDLGDFRGLATLDVDGQIVRAEAAQPTDRARASLSTGFRIAPALTGAAHVVLVVAVRREDAMAAVFPSAPVLTDSDASLGQRQQRRAWYLRSATLAVGALATMSFAYLLLWFLNRRRSAHGWYALVAGGFAITQLYRATILETLAPLDAVANAVAVGCAAVAAMVFVHRHFSLGRVPRALTGLLSALSATALVLAADRFSSVAVRDYVELAVNALVSPYLIARCVLVFRARRDWDAVVLGMGVATLVAVTIANAVDLVPNIFVPTALVINAATGAWVLARGYVASLRRADARLEEVETRNREIDLLNVELRRQIADRSKELVQALVRVDELPARSLHLTAEKVVRGRYRVLRQLGAGGMGAVYEVLRIADGRALALKVLTGAGSGASLARFAQEAQIAATLHHPNLVAIVDVDVAEEGVLFLVMELVPGAPLSDLTEACRDRALLATILRQVAAGLAALHGARIVHRDLKPANILVDRSGEAPCAKIADFGIARLDERRPSEAVDPEAATSAVERPVSMADTVNPFGGTLGAPGSATPLTATGALMGTPLYMAPELANGTGWVAPSSDIWSFGVLALELWTGAYPFAVPPILRALGGRAADPRELEDVLAGVPIAWADLLARCVHTDPAARPTAVVLEEQIARVIAVGSSSTLASAPRVGGPSEA